jgi:hypothetical protein
VDKDLRAQATSAPAAIAERATADSARLSWRRTVDTGMSRAAAIWAWLRAGYARLRDQARAAQREIPATDRVADSEQLVGRVQQLTEILTLPICHSGRPHLFLGRRS